jgi:hypothetical protein
MLKAATFAAIVFAASTAAVWAAPARHAGEWQTVLDDGQPHVVCFPSDETLDENTLMKGMSKIPGANCKMDSLKTVGDVTSYSMQCTIGGSILTSSGTITETGPDAFTTKVHTHGGAIPMPTGKTVTIPDSDTVSVARRLGPCKPGERQITH